MKIRFDEVTENGLELVLSGAEDVVSDAVARIILPPEIGLDPRMTGRLMLLPSQDEVYLEGSVRAKVRLTCSRCLGEFSSEAVVTPGLLIRRRSPQGEREEEESPEASIVFVGGDEIDIGEILVQELLLELPMKPLCREQCRGLCPRCGNFKESPDCKCSDEDTADARWAALAELKKKIAK